MFSGSKAAFGPQYGGWRHKADCSKLPAKPRTLSRLPPGEPTLNRLCELSFELGLRIEGGGNPAITSATHVPCPASLVAPRHVRTARWKRGLPARSSVAAGGDARLRVLVPWLLGPPPFIIRAAAEVRVPEARAGAVRRLHEIVHVHHPRERRPVPMLKVQGADLVGEAPRVRDDDLVTGLGPGDVSLVRHTRELLDEGWDGAARWLRPAWLAARWPFHLLQAL